MSMNLQQLNVRSRDAGQQAGTTVRSVFLQAKIDLLLDLLLIPTLSGEL